MSAGSELLDAIVLEQQGAHCTVQPSKVSQADPQAPPLSLEISEDRASE